jgi:hypothetical protein
VRLGIAVGVDVVNLDPIIAPAFGAEVAISFERGPTLSLPFATVRGCLAASPKMTLFTAPDVGEVHTSARERTHDLVLTTLSREVGVADRTRSRLSAHAVPTGELVARHRAESRSGLPIGTSSVERFAAVLTKAFRVLSSRTRPRPLALVPRLGPRRLPAFLRAIASSRAAEEVSTAAGACLVEALFCHAPIVVTACDKQATPTLLGATD